MSPITHFLASWAIAETRHLNEADKKWVTWAGVAPDLDGLGIVPDMVASHFFHVDLGWYAQYHRMLFHGVWGAVLISIILCGFARRRALTFAGCMIAVHVHFLCDVLGSRGPNPGDIWPISYLAPISDALTVSWSGQWAINAWPNVVFTLILMGFVFFRAATHGHSPVSLFSASANVQFVRTIRKRIKR